jgi:hypothetical protein
LTGTDVIEDLRRERPAPDVTHAEQVVAEARGLAVPAPRQPHARGRRGRWSLVVAATLAMAAVVATIIEPASDSRTAPAPRPAAHPAIGEVSDAEARELVLVALRQATGADDVDMTQRYRAVEVAAPHRVDERRIRTVVIGEDVSEVRSSRDDYANKRSKGLETRFVGGVWYHEYAGDDFEQRWMYDLRMHGNQAGLMLGSADQARSFNPAAMVAQLEREGLATVRRTDDGGVAVEFERPARQLAPVAGGGGLDPIGSATFRLAAYEPNAPVRVRIEVAPSRELRRVQVSYVGDVAQRGGPRRLVRIRSRVTSDVTLAPTDGRSIEQPDPDDVMVVGDPIATRLGADGIDGPHGVLAELSDQELDDLLDELRQDMQARAPKAQVRQRSPQERAVARDRLRRVIDAYRAYEPIDRRRLVDDPACVPSWPVSRRRMDAGTARADPRRANWTCTLADGIGSVLIRRRGMPIITARPTPTSSATFGARQADQMLEQLERSAF